MEQCVFGSKLMCIREWPRTCLRVGGDTVLARLCLAATVLKLAGDAVCPLEGVHAQVVLLAHVDRLRVDVIILAANEHNLCAA